MIPHVKVHACGGSTKLKDDIERLKNKVHIIAGTPGRIQDNIRRGLIKADYLTSFIVYQADGMLSKDFKKQGMYIFAFLPRDI